MANMRWATALLLFLYCLAAPANAGLQESFQLAQEDYRVERCRMYWQPHCTALGVPEPGGTPAAVAGPAEREQQIARCRVYWEPSCAELGVPSPPAPTVVSEPTEREQQIVRCRAEWQPACAELGVPNPAEAWEREERRREIQTVQSLLERGPMVQGFPHPYRFTATGFIRSGWPVVVRYQIPAGSTATLTVTPQFRGGRGFQIDLPRSIDGSPQLYRFDAEVPGSDGRPVVASYAITARSFSPAAGRELAATVKILGFGAGRRAVGSVAIDEINYDPPRINKPRDNSTIVVTYRYRLKNEWDRVAEDLWRDCPGVSLFCHLQPRIYRPPTQGLKQWKWFVNRGTKNGLYQLKIRAWKTCGALADAAAYRQCGDEADWVIGSAGPILIRNQ